MVHHSRLLFQLHTDWLTDTTAAVAADYVCLLRISSGKSIPVTRVSNGVVGELFKYLVAPPPPMHWGLGLMW